MDARTPDHEKLRHVDDEAPAIVVAISSQIGPNRTMSMQFAVPLGMTPTDMNVYVDKVMSVSERQNDKGILEQMKLTLESARKSAMTTIEQKAACEAKFALEFTVSNRRGDFKPNSSQQTQLNNFDATLNNLRDTVIPKLERDIADLEKKIASGV